MDTYNNKIVLVTGASSGIGKAMANDLAAEGAELILTARSQDQLEALANQIKEKGGQAHVFTGDLAQAGSAETLHQQIIDANLHVDVLVNNAGYGRWGQFGEFGRDDYAAMIQLNITSLTDLCHLFMPAMVNKGEGGVINIGSSASFLPVPYASVYSSTKAYVLMLSEALRYEYADSNVRVMASCPGATDSNFRNTASEKSSEQLKQRISKLKGAGEVGDTCERVSQETLNAFLQNKHYIVPGKGNSKFAFLPRILSRARVLKLTGDTFKKHTAS
tara:strand:+ start:5466 stop:6290 length:825 start_codon:yes stop_codon:yes gene_type:complete